MSKRYGSGRVLMGITGWIFIAGGAVMAGRAVPQLARARRSGAPADAIAAGAWSSLVVGLGSLATGALYLGDHRRGLYWIAGCTGSRARSSPPG